MKEMMSKLVGVSFDGRQDNVKKIQPGFNLFWVHEKDNQYDPNAIKVFADPEMVHELGHLKKELAEQVVEWLADGKTMMIVAEQVTGGKDNQTFGLNIRIVVQESEQ
jgi:single-stranded-DNA-specific exonuclease